MYIDPHVHCRDGSQSYKEIIAHAFQVADAQGVRKIFDMPNIDPPITREEHVLERFKLVPKERISDYFLWIGATSDKNQLEEAVRCYGNFQNVVGLKMFAGKSVGDLTVLEKADQEEVYRTLKNLNYSGVIAVHCEKESLLKNKSWNPKSPITHSQARPVEAEVESIKDQIELAGKTGFTGTLHICHITSSESVALVDEARKNISITCGVTPHHVIWDDSMMQRPDGLLYKMNPPLRNKETVESLRKCIKKGKVDWIETDYAPHQVGEKMFQPYMSGYPSLCLYKDFVENFLPSIGIGEGMIKKMTYDNIVKVFGKKYKEIFYGD